MYLFNVNGTIYWGSYGVKGLLEYDQVMRRKPVRLNRWYCTKQFQFRMTYFPSGPYNAGGLMIELIQKKVHGHFGVPAKGECIYYDEYGVAHKMSGTNNPAGKQAFINCFKNRLREYVDSHFVPMSRRIPNVR